MYRLAVFTMIVVLATSDARLWNNPVLDGDNFSNPSVIYDNGIYYVVTSTTDNARPLAIHSSTDLLHWNLEGYVFETYNFPFYDRNINGVSLEIKSLAAYLLKIGPNGYRVYFTIEYFRAFNAIIGVAVARNIRGPYTALKSSLIECSSRYCEATLIQERENLILVWARNARDLTEDGLNFIHDHKYINFIPNYRNGDVRAPFYFKRSGLHYLFYSRSGSVWAARSNVSSLGPYDELSTPILTSNELFEYPGGGSVVRDTDGVGWVYVYHASRAGLTKEQDKRFLFTSSIEWGEDNWPKKMEF